jgi:hypothetical protein
MDIQVRAACWEAGDKIRIKLGNQKLAIVYLPVTGSYFDWEIFKVENINIPAGENQVLRLEFMNGSFNLDWLNFVAREINNIDEGNSKKPYTFYPNPAHDYIMINSNEKSVLEIYTIYGQLLIQEQLPESDNTISVNNLPSGSYIVKITNNTHIHSEMLVVE